MCFVFYSEQTATCATYSINWLVFITEMKSVYSAVRTGFLNKAVYPSPLKVLYESLLNCKKNISIIDIIIKTAYSKGNTWVSYSNGNKDLNLCHKRPCRLIKYCLRFGGSFLPPSSVFRKSLAHLKAEATTQGLPWNLRLETDKSYETSKNISQ